MADGVRLDIVLTDDGQPATRPPAPPAAVPPGSPPPPGQGEKAAERYSPEAQTPPPRGEAQPPAQPGGEEKERAGATWLSRLKQAGELFEGAAKRFERFAAPLASNDYLGAFKSAAESAGEGLEKLGPYGQAAGAALQSLTGVVESMGSVASAFIERGKELAQFSPDLAVSRANAELSSLFADMKEAEELGPGLARMTDAQTEMLGFLRDTFLPIKKWIIGSLAPAMEYVTATLQNIVIIGEDIYKALQPILDALGAIVQAITSAIGQAFTFIDQQLGLAARRAQKFGEKAAVATAEEVFQRLIEDVIRRGAGPLDRADPVLEGAAP
jgi:hypothetical protein